MYYVHVRRLQITMAVQENHEGLRQVAFSLGIWLLVSPPSVEYNPRIVCTYADT